MARGWESKSVEMQIEERNSAPSGPPPTAEEVSHARKRELLELSRKRIVAELKGITSDRLRALKVKALAHVEGELKELEESK